MYKNHREDEFELTSSSPIKKSDIKKLEYFGIDVKNHHIGVFYELTSTPSPIFKRSFKVHGSSSIEDLEPVEIMSCFKG